MTELSFSIVTMTVCWAAHKAYEIHSPEALFKKFPYDVAMEQTTYELTIFMGWVTQEFSL